MYLLDATVVSELRKIRSGKPDANVARWADSVQAIELCISVITLQELEIDVLLAELRDLPQGKVSVPGLPATFYLHLNAVWCQLMLR